MPDDGERAVRVVQQPHGDRAEVRQPRRRVPAHADDDELGLFGVLLQRDAGIGHRDLAVYRHAGELGGRGDEHRVQL
jgi:hypothetical protein